jgi:hypothetical protein
MTNLTARFRTRFAVLAELNVLPLSVATLFNAAGNNVYGVALGYLAYELTGFPLAVGAVLGARTLPLLFMGLISGGINDRMHRPTILRPYALYYTALSFGFTSLLYFGDVQVQHMVVYMFLVGLGFAFGPTARRAIYADSVPRSRVIEALAVDGTMFSIGHLTMPAIVGLVLTVFGASTAFAMQCGLYSIMTMLAFRVNTPRREVDTSTRLPFFKSIVEGLAYARGEPGVLRMLALSASITLVGTDFVYALVPVVSLEVFDAGPAGIGLILAGIAGGGLTGPFALLFLRSRFGTAGALSAALLVMGLAMIVFALAPVIGVAVGAFAVAGAAVPAMKAASDGYIQLAVANEFRGRIGSLNQITRGVSSLSAFLAGASAQFLGVQTAILLAAACVIVIALWSTTTFRKYPVDGW